MQPVTRSKDIARASYDRLSRWYDRLAGSELHLTLRCLDLLDVSAGESVLEIGYGTGQGLLRLAQRVEKAGRVCGIDISPGMREVTRQRLERAGLADRVELRTGDAGELNDPDCTFDAIFMSFTLELFDSPEIPHLLSLCRRLLKPGGRLGVVALSDRRPNAWMVRLYGWFHTHLPAWVDCRPIPARRSIEVAGFTILQCLEVSSWGLPVDLIVAKAEK